MCFPKAPKQDPQVAIDQAQRKQEELDRLAETKKQVTQQQRRAVGRSGVRSLLSPATPPGGYLS
jgi:hypothetical protein